MNLIGYATMRAFTNLEKIRGNHDNTGETFVGFIPTNWAQFVSEVGLFITNELQLDLPLITSKLNDKVNEKWLVEEVGRDKVEHGVVSRPNLKARSHDHGN